MIGFFCFIGALAGLHDLFQPARERVIPWWGDVIVIIGSGVVYIVATKIGVDDE